MSDASVFDVVLITDLTSQNRQEIERLIRNHPELRLALCITHKEHSEDGHVRDLHQLSEIENISPQIVWVDLDGHCPACGLSTLRLLSESSTYKLWSNYAGQDGNTIKFAIHMGAESLDSSTVQRLEAEVETALSRVKQTKIR